MNQVQFVVFLSRFFFFTNCFSCFTYNSENYNHLQVLWGNNLLFLLTSQEMKYSFKEENCGIQSLSLSLFLFTIFIYLPRGLAFMYHWLFWAAMFITFIIPKIMSWGAINLHYFYDLSLFGLNNSSFTASLKNIIAGPQFYRD